MKPCAALLLAAGSSRRFGGDKLLHPLADGTPMAIATLRHLRAGLGSGVEVLAILRPDQDELARQLNREDCRLVACDTAAAGMGASLAAGVAASGRCCGWIVALADMPFIEAATYRSVCGALAAGAALAAPYFGERRGHPVGFAGRYREALLSLAGDEGARQILARHSHLITRIATEDPGILRDIDTRADLPLSPPRP